MASLKIVTLTFTIKKIKVIKCKAVVFATNQLEAEVLLKKKCPEDWALLDVEERPDKGFLVQGKSYNPKPRVHSVREV